MATYPDLDELDKLWPDEGYAVIIEDEMKQPDSDDFVNILQQFESPEFDFPGPRKGYSYWVHDANGNRYHRDEWNAYRKLVEALQKVLSEHPVEETLSELKEKGQRRWERSDVIWFEIVLSLSTLRGSYGSQLVMTNGQIDEHRYGSVAFRTLEQVDPDHRNKYLEARLYGNVPMHPTKAEALERNFELIKENYDDPEGAKEEFEQKSGVEEKINFLKQFELIGDKYARNIPMDLYLEESRDFIAIDSRIKNLLKDLGYPLDKRQYEANEQFLRTVAGELGIEPWELDRTLYNFRDEIEAIL
jgi:hypothetical protein